METELHWPEMKASEDLDFHCTSVFNYRLFLHHPSHQLHVTASAPPYRHFCGIQT